MVIDIIDVTLRDGGHAVDFDWPIEFAREYYNLMCSLTQVKTIELGYWGQTSKSKNFFYNLDYDKVCEVSQKQNKNNISVMIDYHYCSHDVTKYPSVNQSEISMIRLCSRKEDICNALSFGKALKEFCKINISFNVFNASNYTQEEAIEVAHKVIDFPFDYVYFADTHGSLDLTKDLSRFTPAFDVLKSRGKKVGFHLHDHMGLAVTNYKELLKNKIDSTDTSVRGMGKGSGNLKLEHIIQKSDISKLSDLIFRHKNILSIQPLVHELITSSYGLTDNYAKTANELNLSIDKFDTICSQITGHDKDNFNPEVFKV
jgi:4-hydroxy 2-oxovalerate aldolase